MEILEIDNCVLSVDQPPMSNYYQLLSKYYYEKLKLGTFKVFGNNIEEFWMKLSKTVTILDVTKFQNNQENLLKMISLFKGLKTVYLDQVMFLDNIRGREKSTNFFKQNLIEELHIHNFHDDDNLMYLLEFFPNVKEIYIESAIPGQFLSLKFIQTNSCLIKKIILNISTREFIQIISELKSIEKLNLREIECRVEKEQSLEVLLEFLETQKNLTSVALYTQKILTRSVPHLNTLYIDFVQDIVFLKPLELHSNLTELHLKLSRIQHRTRNQISECFFGHVKLELTALQKVYLEGFSQKLCIECYKNMFESCLNVKKLSIVQTRLSTSAFVLLTQHLTKLEELKVELSRISESEIETMCKSSTILKKLDLKATVVHGDSDSIIKTICSRLLELQELRINMLDLTETSFDHVANYCYNLRILCLPISGSVDLERIFRPFQILPKLEKICQVFSQDLTRIDYYEVFVCKTKTLESYLGRNWNRSDYYVFTWDCEEENLENL